MYYLMDWFLWIFLEYYLLGKRVISFSTQVVKSIHVAIKNASLRLYVIFYV